MISIVKKKNKVSRNLLSKIEWACRLNAIKLEGQIFISKFIRSMKLTKNKNGNFKIEKINFRRSYIEQLTNYI